MSRNQTVVSLAGIFAMCFVTLTNARQSAIEPKGTTFAWKYNSSGTRSSLPPHILSIMSELIPQNLVRPVSVEVVSGAFQICRTLR